jgi:hypothetical protein
MQLQAKVQAILLTLLIVCKWNFSLKTAGDGYSDINNLYTAIRRHETLKSRTHASLALEVLVRLRLICSWTDMNVEVFWSTVEHVMENQDIYKDQRQLHAF